MGSVQVVRATRSRRGPLRVVRATKDESGRARIMNFQIGSIQIIVLGSKLQLGNVSYISKKLIYSNKRHVQALNDTLFTVVHA